MFGCKQLFHKHFINGKPSSCRRQAEIRFGKGKFEILGFIVKQKNINV